MDSTVSPPLLYTDPEVAPICRSLTRMLKSLALFLTIFLGGITALAQPTLGLAATMTAVTVVLSVILLR